MSSTAYVCWGIYIFLKGSRSENRTFFWKLRQEIFFKFFSIQRLYCKLARFIAGEWVITLLPYLDTLTRHQRLLHMWLFGCAFFLSMSEYFLFNSHVFIFNQLNCSTFKQFSFLYQQRLEWVSALIIIIIIIYIIVVVIVVLLLLFTWWFIIKTCL